MAKKKWIIPVAIVGGFLQTIIFLLFVVILLGNAAFGISYLFGERHGPYHKPAITHSIHSSSFIKSPYKENEYYYCVDEGIYKLDNDGVHLVKRVDGLMDLYEDNGQIYGDINRYSNWPFTKAFWGTYLFDENWNVEKKVSGIGEIAINNHIYSNYNGSKIRNFSIETNSYDDENEIPLSDLYDFTGFLEIDGQMVFVCENGEMQKVNNLNTYAFLKRPYLKNKNYYIYWYQNSFELPQDICAGRDVSLLSDEIVNDKCIFSITEKSYDDKCPPSPYNNCDCICGFGETTVYSFDTTTLEIEEISTLHSGCVPIQAEEGVIRYYYDGYFYENDNKVSQTETITVGPDYYEVGEDTWSSGNNNGWYYLTYLNSHFYMIKDQ